MLGLGRAHGSEGRWQPVLEVMQLLARPGHTAPAGLAWPVMAMQPLAGLAWPVMAWPAGHAALAAGSWPPPMTART